MNKKLKIGLAAACLIAVFFAGYYVGQHKMRIDLISKVASLNQVSKTIDNAAFTMDVPEGWMEQPSISGVTATIVKDVEEHEDEALNNINFKSYFMITYDEMKSRAMPQYVEYIKEQLRKSIPDIVFDKEESMKIGEQEGYLIESHERQQGADFKSLLALVKDKADGIWLISFNTAQKDWEKYSETAITTINSFIVK
jgi:hypothetical protein